MVVVPKTLTAEVRTGKFWRLLAPGSVSPGSFGVTSSWPRSIPSSVFEKIAFAEIRFCDPETMETPVPPLGHRDREWPGVG